METERTLIDKILGGNLHAFKELVEKYQRLVVHVVFRLVSQPDNREDICQDVFIKVYQNLASFKYQSKFSTWIAKIAYTTTLNYLRKEKIVHHGEMKQGYEYFEYENEELNPINIIQTSDPSPLEKIEKRDISNLIYKNIEKLPTPYVTILTLYHLEQMSYQEIAEILQ